MKMNIYLDKNTTKHLDLGFHNISLNELLSNISKEPGGDIIHFDYVIRKVNEKSIMVRRDIFNNIDKNSIIYYTGHVTLETGLRPKDFYALKDLCSFDYYMLMLDNVAKNFYDNILAKGLSTSLMMSTQIVCMGIIKEENEVHFLFELVIDDKFSEAMDELKPYYFYSLENIETLKRLSFFDKHGRMILDNIV